MSDLKRLMYFEQDGCAPCKRWKPVAVAIAEEIGIPLELVDLNGDNGMEHALAYNVKAAPTLIVVGAKGQRLGGMIGGMISLERVRLLLR
jgi:thioredoxin-like negative regulator of GroEL